MRRFFVLAAIFVVATPDPIIIRSGINKDQAQKKDSNLFDHHSVKGISNFEGEEGFNKANENKHVKAEDSGHYNEENGLKKLHANENNFADNKFHEEAGGNVEDSGKKSENKKGHHKKGFTKSYHKDETGSEHSYYDDSDDEGGEYVRNSKKNSYGDAGQHNQRGSGYDDRKYLQDNAKKGHYDNAGHYEKDLANQRGYSSKKYLDDREDLGRKNLANEYGEADRFAEEQFIKKHHHEPFYHEEPYYRPIAPPKRTITIYEDPRYIDDGYERYPQYENDHIHLDIKRPPRDYDAYRYYERPLYEDFYY